MVGLAGITARDCNVSEVTVSVVLPETLANVAVMTEEPSVTLVTIPFAATLATEVVSEAQLTADVISLEVPSE